MAQNFATVEDVREASEVQNLQLTLANAVLVHPHNANLIREFKRICNREIVLDVNAPDHGHTHSMLKFQTRIVMSKLHEKILSFHVKHPREYIVLISPTYEQFMEVFNVHNLVTAVIVRCPQDANRVENLDFRLPNAQAFINAYAHGVFNLPCCQNLDEVSLVTRNHFSMIVSCHADYFVSDEVKQQYFDASDSLICTWESVMNYPSELFALNEGFQVHNLEYGYVIKFLGGIVWFNGIDPDAVTEEKCYPHSPTSFHIWTKAFENCWDTYYCQPKNLSFSCGIVRWYTIAKTNLKNDYVCRSLIMNASIMNCGGFKFSVPTHVYENYKSVARRYANELVTEVQLIEALDSVDHKNFSISLFRVKSVNDPLVSIDFGYALMLMFMNDAKLKLKNAMHPSKYAQLIAFFKNSVLFGRLTTVTNQTFLGNLELVSFNSAFDKESFTKIVEGVKYIYTRLYEIGSCLYTKLKAMVSSLNRPFMINTIYEAHGYNHLKAVDARIGLDFENGFILRNDCVVKFEIPARCDVTKTFVDFSDAQLFFVEVQKFLKPAIKQAPPIMYYQHDYYPSSYRMQLNTGLSLQALMFHYFASTGADFKINLSPIERILIIHKKPSFFVDVAFSFNFAALAFSGSFFIYHEQHGHFVNLPNASVNQQNILQDEDEEQLVDYVLCGEPFVPGFQEVLPIPPVSQSREIVPYVRKEALKNKDERYELVLPFEAEVVVGCANFLYAISDEVNFIINEFLPSKKIEDACDVFSSTRTHDCENLFPLAHGYWSVVKAPRLFNFDGELFEVLPDVNERTKNSSIHYHHNGVYKNLYILKSAIAHYERNFENIWLFGFYPNYELLEFVLRNVTFTGKLFAVDCHKDVQNLKFERGEIIRADALHFLREVGPNDFVYSDCSLSGKFQPVQLRVLQLCPQSVVKINVFNPEFEFPVNVLLIDPPYSRHHRYMDKEIYALTHPSGKKKFERRPAKHLQEFFRVGVTSQYCCLDFARFYAAGFRGFKCRHIDPITSFVRTNRVEQQLCLAAFQAGFNTFGRVVSTSRFFFQGAAGCGKTLNLMLPFITAHPKLCCVVVTPVSELLKSLEKSLSGTSTKIVLSQHFHEIEKKFLGRINVCFIDEACATGYTYLQSIMSSLPSSCIVACFADRQQVAGLFGTNGGIDKVANKVPDVMEGFQYFRNVFSYTMHYNLCSYVRKFHGGDQILPLRYSNAQVDTCKYTCSTSEVLLSAKFCDRVTKLKQEYAIITVGNFSDNISLVNYISAHRSLGKRYQHVFAFVDGESKLQKELEYTMMTRSSYCLHVYIQGKKNNNIDDCEYVPKKKLMHSMFTEVYSVFGSFTGFALTVVPILEEVVFKHFFGGHVAQPGLDTSHSFSNYLTHATLIVFNLPVAIFMHALANYLEVFIYPKFPHTQVVVFKMALLIVASLYNPLVIMQFVLSMAFVNEPKYALLIDLYCPFDSPVFYILRFIGRIFFVICAKGHFDYTAYQPERSKSLNTVFVVSSSHTKVPAQLALDVKRYGARSKIVQTSMKSFVDGRDLYVAEPFFLSLKGTVDLRNNCVPSVRCDRGSYLVATDGNFIKVANEHGNFGNTQLNIGRHVALGYNPYYLENQITHLWHEKKKITKFFFSDLGLLIMAFHEVIVGSQVRYYDRWHDLSKIKIVDPSIKVKVENLGNKLIFKKVLAFTRDQVGIRHKSSSVYWNTLTLIMRFNYERMHTYAQFMKNARVMYGSNYLFFGSVAAIINRVKNKCLLSHVEKKPCLGDALTEAWLMFFVKQCAKKGGISRVSKEDFCDSSPLLTDFLMKDQTKLEGPFAPTKHDQLVGGQSVNIFESLYSLNYGCLARCMGTMIKICFNSKFMLLAVDGWNNEVSAMHFREHMCGEGFQYQGNDVSMMDTSHSVLSLSFFSMLFSVMAELCGYDVSAEHIFMIMNDASEHWKTSNRQMGIKAEANYMLSSGHAWTLMLNTVTSLLITFLMMDERSIVAGQFKGDDSIVATYGKPVVSTILTNLHRIKVKPVTFKSFPEFCHLIYSPHGCFPIVSRVLVKFYQHTQPLSIHALHLFTEYLLGWKEQLRVSLSRENFKFFCEANVNYHVDIAGANVSNLVISMCVFSHALFNADAKRLFKCLFEVVVCHQH